MFMNCSPVGLSRFAFARPPFSPKLIECFATFLPDFLCQFNTIAAIPPHSAREADVLLLECYGFSTAGQAAA
jgi:hypothetical protein